MSTSNTVLEARTKIKSLLSYFDQKKLPLTPIRLGEHKTIVNCDRYVDRLKGGCESLDVRSMEVQASYSNLQELKIYLENN